MLCSPLRSTQLVHLPFIAPKRPFATVKNRRAKQLTLVCSCPTFKLMDGAFRVRTAHRTSFWLRSTNGKLTPHYKPAMHLRISFVCWEPHSGVWDAFAVCRTCRNYPEQMVRNMLHTCFHGFSMLNNSKNEKKKQRKNVEFRKPLDMVWRWCWMRAIVHLKTAQPFSPPTPM